MTKDKASKTVTPNLYSILSFSIPVKYKSLTKEYTVGDVDKTKK